MLSSWTQPRNAEGSTVVTLDGIVSSKSDVHSKNALSSIETSVDGSVRKRSDAQRLNAAAARPWLRGAWPCNPRLPRPKPTHDAARKVAVTPTELAKRTLAVFERAGAPEAACFSDMLLEHMLARYPVLWSGRDVVDGNVNDVIDDDEWIASRARRIRQGVLARYSWQLDQFDRRLRRLSPADPEYADAARQRAQTWHAIRERAEEEIDAFTRCELGAAQRAHHARREWAAVRMQRCVSHWLYKPPGGPMFCKGLRSLRGSVLQAPEASAPAGSTIRSMARPSREV